MSTPAPTGDLHAAGFAADPASGGAIAFGGERVPAAGGRESVAFTQLWDGTRWRQADPMTAPPPRQHPVMVADPATGQTLMFGGTTSSAPPLPARQPFTPAAPAVGQATPLGANHISRVMECIDAWSWDGATWTPLEGYQAQVRGIAHFHTRVGAPLLVGRLLPTSSARTYLPMPAGTWRWDENRWRLLTVGAPAEDLTCLAEDPSTGVLIGLAARSPFIPPPRRPGSHRRGASVRRGYAHAWTFTGDRWVRDVALDPPEQVDSVMAEDPTTGHLVLTNARGHTWTLDGQTWTKAHSPDQPGITTTDPNVRLRTATTVAGIVLVVTAPHSPDQTWIFTADTWRQSR